MTQQDSSSTRTRQLYDYAATARRNGSTWDAIQKELCNFGASPELARQIIDALSKKSEQQLHVKSGDKLRKMRENSTRGTGCFNVVMGVALCAVGIFITMTSYNAAARSGGFYVITYGLIFSGAAQALGGLILFGKGRD